MATPRCPAFEGGPSFLVRAAVRDDSAGRCRVLMRKAPHLAVDSRGPRLVHSPRSVGWAVSSAVEHCFHTAGATGSIPVPPTIKTGLSAIRAFAGFTVIASPRCVREPPTRTRYEHCAFRARQAIGLQAGKSSQFTAISASQRLWLPPCRLPTYKTIALWQKSLLFPDAPRRPSDSVPGFQSARPDDGRATRLPDTALTLFRHFYLHANCSPFDI